jgi:hypothetical protein
MDGSDNLSPPENVTFQSLVGIGMTPKTAREWARLPNTMRGETPLMQIGQSFTTLRIDPLDPKSFSRIGFSELASQEHSSYISSLMRPVSVAEHVHSLLDLQRLFPIRTATLGKFDRFTS